MGFHQIEEFDALVKGKKVKRERIIIPSAVAGLAVDLDNRMVFVMQYRPCVDKYMLEIPAGVLDMEGLTPFETLLVELEEECEISRDKIGEYSVPHKPIHKYHTIAGSSDATTEIYEVFVNTVLPKRYMVDDADVESVYTLSVGEVRDYLESGIFKDAKTIIAARYFLESNADE